MRKRFAATVVMIGAAQMQPAAANRRVYRIEMRDVAFTPAQVTVHAGDTLEWDNEDIVAHTATSQEAGFDVAVPPGGKGSTAVTRPGTFSYTCRYHPNMRGQIVVEP
jgi:plastocyanin